MKRTKKLLALLLALSMSLALAACGGTAQEASSAANEDANAAGSETAESAENAAAAEEMTESDLAYVQNKGTLVVGITEFEPMDYQDADGTWIGFDADMARQFAASLGVEPEFQLINWDSKVMELDGRTIDVVWNGMTLTDEVLNSMECSKPYFDNAQVVVVSKDAAENYRTAESMADLAFAVESGSAGMEQAQANGFQYTEVTDQATALLEVASGTADAAIIDFLMAAAMVGEGTSYENLAYTIGLNTEAYGVGFRKGSDLAAALNDFFAASYEDGSMQAIAERYNLQDALVDQTA